MKWQQKIRDFHQLLFPHHHSYTLFDKTSSYQHLSVKYQPQINFLGMFSNNKFMAGYNTKTKLPWNSPFFLTDFYLKKPKEILFLGGGPCCAPTTLWERDKSRPISIDIVEQDPLVIKLATKFFDLPQDPSVSIHHTKAEQFLEENKKKYDVIFFDLGFAYERRNDIKFSFCSQNSTLEQLKNSLTPQGIIIYVVISHRQGNQKKFLNQLYKKFNKIFKNCELYSDAPQNNKKNQSHIFILSQKNKLVSQFPPTPSQLNDHWLNLYRELQDKKTSLSTLTL
jgi:spermidine synthase